MVDGAEEAGYEAQILENLKLPSKVVHPQVASGDSRPEYERARDHLMTQKEPLSLPAV